MKRICAALFSLALFSIHYGVSATTITVDPGPVGTVASDFDFDFSDLDGVALQGQLISLSFVFDHMKQVEVPVFNNFDYQAALRFSASASQSIDSAGGTAFFTGANGSPLSPPSDVATKGTNHGWAYFLRTSLDNGLVHHGVRFDVSLPDINGLSIDGGSLTLDLIPSGGPPQLTVGQWSALPAVPEPASLLLLSLALAAMGMAGQRKPGGRLRRD